MKKTKVNNTIVYPYPNAEPMVKNKWKILILISCIFLLAGCNWQNNQKNLPKNLDEAVSYFENTWSESQKEDFRKLPEDSAVAQLHFSVGLWIRNNWIRNDGDPGLKNYFNSIGVSNPDDISSIILTSLHRKLNNRQVDLNGQVESYKAYWEPIMNCEEKSKKEAVENYNKFNIGDPVTIYMQVDVSDGIRNAVGHVCPQTDWTFSPEKDLVINGTVEDKYNISSPENVFFKVRINKMNFENTKILYKDAKIGDIMSFSLNLLRIE